MTTTAQTPIAGEIGEAAIVRIETLRARGRSARQIADTLGLDFYVVDEVFAWHDLLCSFRRDRPTRSAAQFDRRFPGRAVR